MQPAFNCAAAPLALASPRSLSPSFDLNSSVYASAALAAQIQQLQQQLGMPSSAAASLHLAPQLVPFAPAQQLLIASLPASASAAASSAAPLLQSPLCQRAQLPQHPQPVHHDTGTASAGFEANADAQVRVQCGPRASSGAGGCNGAPQELLDAIAQSAGSAAAAAAVDAIAASASASAALEAFQSASRNADELQSLQQEQHMHLAAAQAAATCLAPSEPPSTLDHRLAIPSLVKRVSQLEAAVADREATLKEQSAVLQSAFVTIVSNRRLLQQLQQDQQASIKELHQKHAAVLSQAEAAALQYRAEAEAAAKRAVEATAEAQAAAREARMFEVAMNLSKTEARTSAAAVEQLRREAEVLQGALSQKDDAINALRIEVAGLKASFKRIAAADGAAPVEHADAHARAMPQQQQPAPSQSQPRAALTDSEHWLQGATIALASLPSPSPRRPEAACTADAFRQQQLPPARVFGTLVDANVDRKGSAPAHAQKQLQKQQQQQQQQQQVGAWPLQRQQHEGSRLEHAVSWTSGGYSDAAAKKQRQQQGGSSRGRLVFLR